MLGMYHRLSSFHWVFQVAPVVKSLPANIGDIMRARFDSCMWKILWRWAQHPLQYSCLENPMDRGAWEATVMRLQRVRPYWSNLACRHPHFTGGLDIRQLSVSLRAWIWNLKIYINISVLPLFIYSSVLCLSFLIYKMKSLPSQAIVG